MLYIVDIADHCVVAVGEVGIQIMSYPNEDFDLSSGWERWMKFFRRCHSFRFCHLSLLWICIIYNPRFHSMLNCQ